MALVTAAVIGAVVTGVLGPSEVGFSAQVGSVSAAVISAFAGWRLIRLGLAESDGARTWIGLAVLGNTLGCLLELTAPWLGAIAHRLLYALLAVGITFCFVRVIANIPSTREPLQLLRMVLEAALFGISGGVTVFRVAFRPVVAGGDVLGAQLLLAVFTGVIGLTIIAIAIEPRPGVPISGLGTIILVAAEIVDVYVGLANQAAWPARMLALLAWALLIWGIFRLPAGTSAPSDFMVARLEGRHLMVFGTMVCLGIGGFLASVAYQPAIDNSTWAMAAVFVMALWLRELVRARQSGRALELLSDQSERDPLTGLLNRRALNNHLVELQSAPPPSISFMTVDLDGFKDVNDLLGHATGDLLLQWVGQALADVCATFEANAFRLGGDEFAVVCPDRSQAPALAEAVREAITASARAVPGAGQLLLDASVGVQHLAGGRMYTVAAAMTALTESGHAMRAAKRSGRGRVVVFDAQLAGRYRRRRLIESRLLSQMGVVGGVYVHFQPLVELSSGRMVGVEALARWEDEVLGVVGPSEFVGVAEECGLIGELGERILREALAGAVSSGLVGRGLSVAVNVSTLQLRVPGFVGVVSGALEGAGVAASQLVVEVTESVFVRPGDPAIRALVELSGLGVGLALDDFGTGYSSLGYLTRLPVRSLKLDRSLTSGLGEARTWAIARSVVEMAVGLGLEVVVEGVETAAQEVAARRLGAQYAQGEYYSPPVALSDLPETFRIGG